MTDLSRIRISDADRSEVIDRLQRATAEGRLDIDELDDRISAALAARTWSEIDPLVEDLPVVDASEPDDPSVASSAAVRAGALATLGAGAISIAGSYWTPWGALLGVVSAVLGTILLLGPNELSRTDRAAVLTGMILGLLPSVFFMMLLVILDR
jgi:hypothetical protein